MNNFVSIEELYRTDMAREEDTLYQIKIKNNIPGQINGLWYYNRNFALYHLKYNDIEKVKQHFYRCGKIDEYLITHYDSRILDSGMANISCVLLSDCLKLINNYATLQHSKYQWMVENGHSTAMYVIQQIIKENWEQVNWGLGIMTTKNKKLNMVLKPDKIFFEGMLERNEAKIHGGIQQLLKDHKKRNKHMSIAQEFISIPALTYAKLAWLKGMEIEIEHPLVPKALLPYKPLEKYDAKYDFLK